MFKRCLENRITHLQNSYKCYLCHYETPQNDFTLILKHVDLKEHKEKLSQVDNGTIIKESELLQTIAETQRRKLVENGITFCKTFNHLRCRFCKSSYQGLNKTIEHIISSTHIQAMNKSMDSAANKKLPDVQKLIVIPSKKIKNLDNVAKEVPEKTVNAKPTVNTVDAYSCIVALEYPAFKCNICKCDISGTQNVRIHVTGRSHLNILQLEKNKTSGVVQTVDNKESAMKPYVLRIQYCGRCPAVLKTPKIAQFHNILHLFKEFPIPFDIDIIRFKISKNGKAIIQCLLCNSLIANEEELEKHLQTSNHLTNLNLFEKIGDIAELNKMNGNEMNPIEIKQKVLKKFDTNHSKDCSNALLCTLCDAIILKNKGNEHFNGKKHLTKVMTLGIGIKNANNISSSDENITIIYDCFLCKKNFSDFIQLFCHYNTSEHQYRLKCFKIVRNNPHITFSDYEDRKIIACTLCKTSHFLCYSAIQHLTSKNHSKHLEEINSANDATSTICNMQWKSKQTNEKTDQKVSELPLKQNNNKTNNITELQSKQNHVEPRVIEFEEKTDGKRINKRKKRGKKKKNEFETSPEELLKLGFSVENLNLMDTGDPFDDVLNDLVNFNLNRTQERKLPLSFKGKKPRTPNTENKKGNSFSKNVKLYGKNYIKLCITPGEENIYNVDPNDIRLMKLSCDFIFPWESEKVCLPCAEQLPNDKVAIFEHLQDEEHIKTMQEMEANDKEFEDYPEQYSDLKLAYLYMGEESDDWIQCYACNIKIKNENLDIQHHSLETNHLTKSQHWKKLSGVMYEEFSTILKDIWYYAQVFICEICQAKYDFEIEFVIHLESEKHRNKVNAASSKNNKFSICPVCITYWYGKTDSFKIHCKASYHKRLVSNGDLMIPNMTSNTLNFLNSVSLKVKSMIEESNKAVFERFKESTLIAAIEETVQCIYPKAKAYIFGSRLSQLAFSDSDADIFLDCEGVYYESTTQEQCQKYLSSVRCYFENNPNVWIVEEIIMVTRVPIIKLRHIPTQLKCDISFINGLSVEKSTLIGNYNHAFITCRELILYLKKWLNLCQISGSDCITTFAISWFVIFYLQLQGILPSVYELIRKNNQTKMIDGWQCGFLENIVANSSVSKLNFSKHLHGFFSYCANFDYKADVICPYLGKVIKKSTFVYDDNLPKEMKIYKDRLKAEKSNIFRFDSPMCIQDPIDLSQNITKAVKKRQLRCFRQYCTESAVEVSKEIET